MRKFSSSCASIEANAVWKSPFPLTVARRSGVICHQECPRGNLTSFYRQKMSLVSSVSGSCSLANRQTAKANRFSFFSSDFTLFLASNHAPLSLLSPFPAFLSLISLFAQGVILLMHTSTCYIIKTKSGPRKEIMRIQIIVSKL